MKQKLITIFTIAILLISQFSFINLNNFVYAVEDHDIQAKPIEKRYFYDQLTEEGKQFYLAMVDMYEEEIFKTGNQDYDLIAHNRVTQEQAEGYANGSQILLNSMGAARDAFEMDYPDVFYVDFSAISLRVTQSANGQYHAYLGTGRRDSYYMPGFTNKGDVDKAVNEYEEKITQLVQEAKSIEGEGDELIKKQVTYVHDHITKNMIYRYEDEVTQGNARTAHDCLVYGEGVCESYTRGFKAVLDRLNIPCVCIFGVYKVSDKQDENHIWNAVKIGEKWYGVDVTHDDPTNKAWTEKNSGHETQQYLLVGDLELAATHIPSGIMSAANYEFTYPMLQLEALRGEKIFADEDLKIKLVEATYDEGDGELLESGTMKVSYQGKNYTENAAEGKYMITKMSQYYPSTDEWIVSDWMYITPEIYDAKLDWEPEEPDPEIGKYLQLQLPHIKRAQFAITNIPPDTTEQGILNGGLYYKGDPNLLTIKSEEVENVWGGDYVAPPYPKKVTPYMSGTLTIGKTFEVTAVYDDKLIPIEGEDFELEVNTISLNADENASTGAKYSKIENLHFDGERTITFKFTPSQMFADNSCSYTIDIKGLIGEKSKKRPVSLSYMAAYPCAVCAYKAQGYDWNVFGQPQLLENSDVATDGWVAKDTETGEQTDNVDISDKISHRLTLVTTKPSEAQSKEMADVLSQSEEYGNEKVLQSETYNIKLTLCKKQIIKTGQGVRVSVGFPAGYGPEDEGVTFKAYHYKVDPATNEITGVEEIDCVVTQYGLVITVQSFSPFTIAVVEDNEANKDKSKSVILSNTTGGKVTSGEETMFKLNPTENKDVTIQADEGYKIEEVVVAGEKVNVSNDKTMNINVTYDQLADNNNIVLAKFVSEQTLQKEADKEESVVQPEPEKVDVSIENTNLTVAGKEKLVISPTLEGEYSYQWYKDGKRLAGQSEKDLTIDSVSKNDAGNYQLSVINTVDSMSTQSTSPIVNVNVKSFDTSLVTQKTDILPGEEFEVTFHIDNFQNIEEGIVALNGQIQYDSKLLEIVPIEEQKLKGEGQWDLSAFNSGNFKFITDNNEVVKSGGDVFKMKFKANTIIPNDTDTQISLTGIEASGGKGTIGAEDAEVTLKLKKSSEQEQPDIPPTTSEEKITSENYVIENNTLSKILPSTTVKQFKENTKTEQTIELTDKDGNTLGEDDLVKTGTKIKVGQTLEYVLVVTGDVDGNGTLGINDIAKLKLHIIDEEKLTDEYLQAADIDYNKNITINDVAKMKLVLIELENI